VTDTMTKLSVVTFFAVAGRSACVTAAGLALTITPPQPNCSDEFRPPGVVLYNAWIVQSTSGA